MRTGAEARRVARDAARFLKLATSMLLAWPASAMVAPAPAAAEEPASVSEVQRTLLSLGFDPGPADGRWGQETLFALLAYQRSRAGLVPSGLLDEATRDSLGVDDSIVSDRVWWAETQAQTIASLVKQGLEKRVGGGVAISEASPWPVYFRDNDGSGERGSFLGQQENKVTPPNGADPFTVTFQSGGMVIFDDGSDVGFRFLDGTVVKVRERSIRIDGGRWRAHDGSLIESLPGRPLDDALSAVLADSLQTAALLERSVTEGLSDLVRDILGAGGNPNAFGPSGGSPLLMAAYAGAPAMVRLLLSAGASPDLGTPEGLTPLAVAAEKGHAECAELLLEAGADANWQSADGRTALFLACVARHRPTVRALLNAGADPTPDRSPATVAAQAGSTDILQDLLDHGAPVEYRVPSGHTLLHLAAQGGHHRTASLLLTRGHPPDPRSTDRGWTPLMAAAWQGSRETVEVLLSHGASPSLRTYDDSTTAADIARERNNVDLVPLLSVPAGDLIEAPPTE